MFVPNLSVPNLGAQNLKVPSPQPNPRASNSTPPMGQAARSSRLSRIPIGLFFLFRSTSLSLSPPLLHPVCSCAVRLLAQDLPVPSGARYDCCHSAWGLSAGQIAIGAKGGITICIYRTASLSHYVKCASTAGAMASALRGSRMPVNDLSDSSGLPLDASLPTLLLSFFATTGSPRYCLEGAPLLQSMALCASATEHECRQSTQ